MKIQVLLAAFCSFGAINAVAVNGVKGVEIRNNQHYSTTKHWQTSKTTAKTTAKTTSKTTKKSTTCTTTSKKTSKTTTESTTTKKITTSAIATTTAKLTTTTPIVTTTTTPILTTPVLTTPVITTPVITTPSTTLLTTTSSAAPVCLAIGTTCLQAASELCCSGNCDASASTCCVPFRGTCNFGGPSGQCCSPYVCGQTNVCVED